MIANTFLKYRTALLIVREQLLIRLDYKRIKVNVFNERIERASLTIHTYIYVLFFSKPAHSAKSKKIQIQVKWRNNDVIGRVIATNRIAQYTYTSRNSGKLSLQRR